MKLYQALAQAFYREGVTDCFALLGDANMHMAGALAELGTHFIYCRHEHGAVAGAASYAKASGRVGVATVTCGPGVTQLMTILPIAVRAQIPLVIFAGEAPLRKDWYNQKIDQAPFVTACGAHYIALHDPSEMVQAIHNAFARAKQEQTVIVIGAPFDLQQDEAPNQAQDQINISDALFVPPAPLMPAGDEIEIAAKWLSTAQRPIILAGLGVVQADASAACIALAEASGALLANTLPAKGLFRDEPFYLGVAGGFATEKAKQIFAQADLVIGIGARLAFHAFNGGKLTPHAKVIHIDKDPQTTVQGRKAADLAIACDARLGAQALGVALTHPQTGWRTDEMKAISADALILPDDEDTPDHFLHPMAVTKALNDLIPTSCHMINTSGHSAYYAAHMNHHPQSHFTVIRDFGAIGNGSSFALGAAVAFPERPVIVIDGDGSALMHIQEWETMVRHGLPILTIIMNDGAYGSEVHKLRADGVTEDGSVFGRPDFAAIGQGFGMTGKQFSNKDTLREALSDAMADYLSSPRPMIWDIHISDKIASPQILAAHGAAHK